MKIFNSKHVQLVRRSLDVYSKQHEALAKNIAHANDPQFKRLKTDFSDKLKSVQDQELRTTNPKHFSHAEKPETSSSEKGEGSVDISKEMSELAVNQIRFDFVSRVLNRTYRKLNSSITGRST